MRKKNNVAYTKRMLTIILRSIIIYLIVLFVFRIMGKRQLGQMQPFELVLTLIIADLATIPMAEISVPVLHGIVPLFTLVILHFFAYAADKAKHHAFSSSERQAGDFNQSKGH